MSIFYINELRNHLIGQDFETPLEYMRDIDIVRDICLFAGAAIIAIHNHMLRVRYTEQYKYVVTSEGFT